MPRIAVHPDLTEAFGFTGAVAGMTAAVQSQIYQADILKFTHAAMAEEFDEHAALMAGLTPERLNHVYEWRMNGIPGAQLWRHRLTGSMGGKTATFEWKASKQPILTPSERQKNPDDPMSQVSDDDIDRLSHRKYFFYWKAPMMEYNMATTIRPVWARALFVPDWGEERGFLITKGPVSKRAGGEMTAGSFTTLWTEWWATRAPAVFQEKIQQIVERDLVRSVEAGARMKKTSTKATIRMQGLTSAIAAREAGMALAEAYLFGRAKSYRAASHYIMESE